MISFMLFLLVLVHILDMAVSIFFTLRREGLDCQRDNMYGEEIEIMRQTSATINAAKEKRQKGGE
jgi:hypothetical protein